MNWYREFVRRCAEGARQALRLVTTSDPHATGNIGMGLAHLMYPDLVWVLYLSLGVWIFFHKGK